MSEHPPIDPTNFDLIVVGTGLPQSVIAAAASSAGKSVLHVDPNPFYGSHFSSLPISDLTSFLNSHSAPLAPPHSTTEGRDFTEVALTTRPLYSDVEMFSSGAQNFEEHSRKFNLDLSGPRVLFCADKSIDLIIKSGASQYIEFKSIDASFVGDETGEFWSVPDSRAAIFRDKSLGLMEKNQLMRFFKLVQGQLASADGSESEENPRISEEDLESSFVNFLKKMRLPPKIKSIILYAIAMVDYDQDSSEVSKDVLKTRDGINRLALYNSSVGRFPNALGALIYPMYGQGELSQAFCRRAAVRGCIHVLRMPVVSLLMDKDGGRYQGVRLASGQDTFSHKLVLDPSFTVPLPLTSRSPNSLDESLQVLRLQNVKRRVARGICIISSSLEQDISNLLVVYPPRTLFPEQDTSIRVLQIGGNLAVCPSGIWSLTVEAKCVALEKDSDILMLYVLYISAVCDEVNPGKKSIQAAMNALLSLPVSENPESSSTLQSENEEVKPTILWSTVYTQQLFEGQFESISFTPMPDGNLNYNDVLGATIELFQQIYPNEELFPATPSPESSEDDNGLTLES